MLKTIQVHCPKCNAPSPSLQVRDGIMKWQCKSCSRSNVTDLSRFIDLVVPETYSFNPPDESEVAKFFAPTEEVTEYETIEEEPYAEETEI